MQRRLFSLEEANQLVPWLERIFQGLAPAMQKLQELRERLSRIQRERQRLNGTFDRYNEYNSLEAVVDSISSQIQGIVDEIIAEGIIAAVQQVGVEVPVIVRFEGNNAAAGLAALEGSGLAIATAATLRDAATKVIAAAGGGT